MSNSATAPHVFHVMVQAPFFERLTGSTPSNAHVSRYALRSIGRTRLR